MSGGPRTQPAAADPLAALQARLGHGFAEPRLLQRALTHRSHSADHYERLEFLGDAVLGLAISERLYRQLQHLPEGDLSRTRASLVRQETLHRIALDLRLPALLRLGEGEARSDGARRPSILADVVEALVGAVYLDAGFAAAQRVVEGLFAAIEAEPRTQAAERDAKTALQEWLQARRLPLPAYRVVATTGAAHRQTFQVACEVASAGHTEHGSGASRRAAEQAAAATMLAHLKAHAP